MTSRTLLALFFPTCILTAATGCSGSGGSGDPGATGLGGASGDGAGAAAGTGAAGRSGGGGASGAGAASGASGNAGVAGVTGAAASGNAGSSAGGSGAAGSSGAGAVDCGSVKWACWPMPTVGNPEGGHPTAQYQDHGDGTLTDAITGLQWQKGLLTGVYSSDTDHVGAWDEALAACEALGTGWRLPTRIELTSIVNHAHSPSALDPLFDDQETSVDTYTSSGWWVSITVPSKPQYTWIFRLANGKYSGFTTNAGARTANANVRCVKSPHHGEGPLDVAAPPPNHYAIASGTVLDNYTGLMWQQGMSPSKLGWQAAKDYCAGLSLGGFEDWRLPAVQELSSLVNEGAVSPAIDKVAFPNTPSGNSGTIVDAATKTVTEESKDWFWTSEPVRGSTHGEAWGLNFMDGFTAIQDVSTVVSQKSDGTWAIRYNFWTTAWTKCVR